MTYWGLNAFFLGATAIIALVAVLSGRAPRWTALGLAAVVLLLTTAVFDNVMIGIGLVDYNPELISGAFIGQAPLEDFAYAIAAVVLLPALWHLLGGRADAAAGPSTSSGTGAGPSTSSGTAVDPSTGSGTGGGEPRA
jgi:lycopene cyclase domain-containing protein